MAKTAIIGDEATISGFSAGGLDGFSAYNGEEALNIIEKLYKEKQYAIIYITETLAKDNIERINELNKEVLPSITIIPDQRGSQGIGIDAIRKSVEKALGLDIIGKELDKWAEK